MTNGRQAAKSEVINQELEDCYHVHGRVCTANGIEAFDIMILRS